jgi:hypothetical protein
MKTKVVYGILLLLSVFVLSYILVVRPWYLRWGATDAEIAMSLPGDAFMEHPTAVSTRAITIHAPASVVWQWLVQLGQGRGGFYSYDWLENLFTADMHNSDIIVPQLQTLNVGDWVLMHPSGATNPAMRAPVVAVEPGKYFVLNKGWGFYLFRVDGNTTRFIVRYTNNDNPIYYYSVFEQAHFIMESGMMLGIKYRAEHNSTRVIAATALGQGAKSYATR